MSETNTDVTRDATYDCAAAQGIDFPSRRGNSSRAVRLLHELIRQKLATAHALSIYLGLSQRQIRECVAGKTRMPLESQRRLADLVVNHVPALAREGRRLQLQCEAEERFLAGETTRHLVAPPGRFR